MNSIEAIQIGFAVVSAVIVIFVGWRWTSVAIAVEEELAFDPDEEIMRERIQDDMQFYW